MQTLGLEYHAGTILFIIICVCLFVIILTLTFVFLSIINHNLQIKEDKIIEEQAELKDRELITQAKTHHRNYPEDFANKLKEKEKHDFKVDFNINLENSIVRTEVVYAE